ncbi:MAG: PAS domain-containing protein [Rhodospirillales bacterium]|nr:PAS domain-containing protein [Rhodospirillales bacterium]
MRHFSTTHVVFLMSIPQPFRPACFPRRRRQTLPPADVHRLATYLAPAALDDLAAGRPVAIADVRVDPRTAAMAEAYRRWNVRAVLLAPWRSEGLWRFLIALVESEPRRWRSDEVALLHEVSARVHIRLERARAEEQLRAAHDTFRHVVDSSPFGVYVVDQDFRLVQVSLGAQRVFRSVRPLVGRDFAEVLRIVWTEPFASEAIARFRHTLTTGEPYHAPATVERRRDSGDTETYDWKIERIVLPGNRHGVVCHFYDLSERQRYEQQIHFLMKEVNHRSKNMLALVLAIARQTMERDRTDFLRRFTERIQALGASQDLLVKSQWQGVDMADLANAQLAHFADLIALASRSTVSVCP